MVQGARRQASASIDALACAFGCARPGQFRGCISESAIRGAPADAGRSLSGAFRGDQPMNSYTPALAWQSRAVLCRHVRVHLRNWHTIALPPVCEPLIMLLAF